MTCNRSLSAKLTAVTWRMKTFIQKEDKDQYKKNPGEHLSYFLLEGEIKYMAHDSSYP